MKLELWEQHLLLCGEPTMEDMVNLKLEGAW